jgi:hypothetical protein
VPYPSDRFFCSKIYAIHSSVAIATSRQQPSWICPASLGILTNECYPFGKITATAVAASLGGQNDPVNCLSQREGPIKGYRNAGVLVLRRFKKYCHLSVLRKIRRVSGRIAWTVTTGDCAQQLSSVKSGFKHDYISSTIRDCPVEYGETMWLARDRYGLQPTRKPRCSSLVALRVRAAVSDRDSSAPLSPRPRRGLERGEHDRLHELRPRGERRAAAF